MKNETMDGLVSYEMSTVDVDYSEGRTCLLNGSVHGFGYSIPSREIGDLGAYDCQYWLKDVLPGKITDGLSFDSESCEFYVYADCKSKLDFIMNLLDRTILEYNRIGIERKRRIEMLFNPLWMYRSTQLDR